MDIATAITVLAADYGIPVLNMMLQSGINSFTAATLLRDGLHPSDFAFTHVVGPTIAQWAAQLG